MTCPPVSTFVHPPPANLSTTSLLLERWTSGQMDKTDNESAPNWPARKEPE